MKTNIMQRLLAGLIVLCMVFSMTSGMIFSANAAEETDSVWDRDVFELLHPDAMHFYIRNWHSDEVSSEDTQFQGTGQMSSGRYFVVVEGYIVPNEDRYDFYFAYQDAVGDYKEDDVVKVDDVNKSAYIESIDPDEGTITLKANPIGDEDGLLESFSGYSISVGHEAVEDNGSGMLIIRYQKNVHLVKGHAFYIQDGRSVRGDNTEIFGSNALTDDPEIDTMWVWVYAKDADDGSYKEGDIVKKDGQALQKSEVELTDAEIAEIKEKEENQDKDDEEIQGLIDQAAAAKYAALGLNVDKSEISLTKFYSTTAGLHTDKTASVHDGDTTGRLFDLKLEAWYTEKEPPSIGFVLDASGSMGFASDVPTPINANEIIEILKSVGKTDEAESLYKKIGAIDKDPETTYVYPQYDKIIGYYPFDGNMSGGTYVLDVSSDLELGLRTDTTGTYSGEETAGVGNAFTIYWYGSNGEVKNDTLITFEDGYESSAYTFFGGNAQQNRRVIKFTTSGPATVKIWWTPSDNGRQMAIMGEDFGELDRSNIQDSQKGIGYIYTYEISNAGTYYVSGYGTDGAGKANFIYKIEVIDEGITDGNPLANQAPQADANAAATPVPEQTAPVPEQTAPDISFDGTVTVNPIINNGKLVISSTFAAGVKLDAEPKGDFTISFSITKSATDNQPLPAEILYVGDLKGSSDYLRVFRNGSTSFYRLRVDAGHTNTQLANVNNVFSSTETNHVILVYKNGQVTTYVYNANGALVDNTPTTNRITLSGKNIIFNPFTDNYNGANIEIDNVIVYDIALERDEVAQLYSAQSSNEDLDATKTVEDGYFLSSRELALLMNPDNTDNSKTGVGGYSYFVYDAREGTAEYTPLGYYTSAVSGVYDTVNRNVSGEEGWYYSSFGSLRTDGGTKTLRGLSAGTYYNNITAGPTTASRGNGAAPDLDNSYTGNTDNSYTAAAGSPVKFFIDPQGYLRCFFASSVDDYFTSYVYELGDRKYVKTEALQRAVGDFVTRLNEKSPGSEIGAVKFSQDSGFKTSDLLLLNWTTDVGKSVAMLVPDNGNTENDYFLTGGTNTLQGLQAFSEYLKDGETVKGDKYIIIFTDGTTTSTESKVKEMSDALKEDDYIIFTVLLAGGPVKYGGDNHDKAKEFLISLSGDTPDVGDEDYFCYADDPEELVDIFANTILKKILVDQEKYTIQDYIDPRFDLVDANGDVWYLGAGGKVTVNGSEQTLSDTGAEFAVKSTYSDEAKTAKLYYDTDKDMYYLRWETQTIPGCAVGAKRLKAWNATITVSAKEDFIGGNAVLTNGTEAGQNLVYPDGKLAQASSGTDMAVPGAGTFLKDDNAVLSKGFPRVSVNVTQAEEDVDMKQTIFMGEELDKSSIAHMIVEAAKADAENDQDNDAYYYWEYIERFIAYFNALEAAGDPDGIIDKLHEMNRSGGYIDPKELDSVEDGHIKIISNRIYDLIKGTDAYGSNPNKERLSVPALSRLLFETQVRLGDDGEFHEGMHYVYLPYIYLPDNPTAQTNSTGKDAHLYDVLGYLFFYINENPDGYPEYPEDGVTRDTRTYKSELSVYFVARNAAARAEWNNKIAIRENDPDSKGPDDDGVIYGRNTVYKPAVGTERSSSKPVVIEGDYTTTVVSGEIALQVVIGAETAERLKKVSPDATITYTAVLKRDGVRVGSFTQSIPVSGLDTANDTLLTVSFTPDEGNEYMRSYGLLFGTYTLEGSFYGIPDVGFTQSTALVSDGSTYTDELFTKGVGNTTPEDYIASVNGNSFILGDRAKATEDSPYTNFRFGLYQAELRIQVPGKLTVEKIIKGAGVNPDDVFIFHITLTGSASADLNGEYRLTGNGAGQNGNGSTVTFVGGKAQVMLKGSQSVTIEGLTAGLGYTVEEERVTDYAVSPANSTGKIRSGETATAVFTNVSPAGGVLITKEVKNGEGDESFSFTVTLSGYSEPLSYKYTDADDKLHEDQSASTLTFYLKDGQSVYIHDLPVGTVVQVTENVGENPAFTTNVEITSDPEGFGGTTEQPNVASVTITKKDETSDALVTFIAAFTNTYPTPSGDLTVTKVVEGDVDASAMEFTFSITGPSDAAGETYPVEGGNFADVTFGSDGTATITVTGAGSATVKGLPVGTYTVTELRTDAIEMEGYTLNVTGEGSAEVTAGGTAQVTVTNAYTQDSEPEIPPSNDPVPPNPAPANPAPDNTGDPGDAPWTGDSSHSGLWMTLMIVSAIGIVAIMFLANKTRTLFSSDGKHMRK